MEGDSTQRINYSNGFVLVTREFLMAAFSVEFAYELNEDQRAKIYLNAVEHGLLQ